MYLRGGYLYEMRFDYRHLQGSAHARLLWSSPNMQHKQLVAPENLFYTQTNPPSKNTQTIKVAAGAASGAHSSAQGVLTLATAGQESQLLLHIRDVYGNSLGAADTFGSGRLQIAARLESPSPPLPSSSHIPHLLQQSTQSDAHGDAIATHDSDFDDAQYQVTFTPTSASAGGLEGECNKQESRLHLHLLHPG